MKGNRLEQYNAVGRFLFSIAAMVLFALTAAGCGNGSSSAPPPSPKPTLSGRVFGGSAGNPIARAQISLYEVGTNGYGTGASQLASVRSGKNGRFKFAGFQCQTGQQLYLVATGGIPRRQSAANAAIALSAAIGTCGGYQRSVVINEVTTAATVWALNQFTDSTGQVIGTAASNQTGLNNAVAVVTASSLVDLATGLTPALLPLGVSPSSDALYTLADLLATCVDSSGAASSECQALFSAATPPGGAAPGTTLEAAVDMARNPGNNVSSLFGLIPNNPPFTPLLDASPSAWGLVIEYDPADTEYNGPYDLAVDAAGSVWAANAQGDSVSVLDAASGYISGSVLGPAGAALSGPTSIVVDVNNNVWVGNYSGSSVSELTASSNYSTGLNFAPAAAAFNGPLAIALDTTGNLFAGNFNAASVSELTASSNYATGLNFAPAGASLSSPASIAVDAQSNIWAANYGNNSVSELTAASNYGTGFNFAPAGASLAGPVSISLDSRANVWVANKAGASVSELIAPNYTTGAVFSPASAAINDPLGVEVDSADNLWVANNAGNNLSELTAASNYTTGLSFAPYTQIRGQFTLALDASGNVWVANSAFDTVSQFIGLANPVLTPAQACLVKGLDVCAP
ncbi:MAG: hypothetical protein IVW54_08810 [Candidatus Binataceae bacterium]|nr:hypothetical protein [Candidatus Binataceae bacterium]